MFGQGQLTDIRKKIENYSFCLNDRIGRGYSSTVYKAKNDLSNQTVAIKVIELKSLKDQVSRNLLKSELQCIRTVNHEHLLRYIDSYETINNCYIITEYCEGGDMEKQLRKKTKYTESELGEIFLQFYSGYKHFSESGYIHRDLKPANIFLTQGKVKIADFGFVKKTTENPKNSYNVGTPVYMPPESLTSNIYSQKSDIWSMGVICYQLTHGKMPWKGINETELKSNIQLKPHVFEANLLSKQCENFINLCLQKNPANRITVKEMWNHPWVQKIRFHSNNKQFTPSYLLPAVRLKNKKLSRDTESCQKSQDKQKKYSTLDYLVSILNYLRFTFKIYKFINQNKIQFKELFKAVLLTSLLHSLQEQELMVRTGDNIFALSDWEEFKKSSKWKVYKSVVDQYSEKYRKMDVDKENLPNVELKSLILDLLSQIKYLKCYQGSQKEIYKNIEALDYVVSLESLKQLGNRDGWSALLEKSPINSIVECRCQVDQKNYVDVLEKLEKKITFLK